MIRPNPKKFDGIQILRAIAALCVLVQHSVYIAGTVAHVNLTKFLSLGIGGFGVCLFFFISGFMMMFQTHKPSYEFALHRFFRIYPPFFLALLLSFLISVPVLGFHYFRFHIRLDFLLLPTGSVNPTFNVPYWTLIYEVFFYTLIFLVILLKIPQRVLNLLLLFWAIVVISAAQFHPITNYAMPNIFQIGASSLCIFFIMGAACGLFYQKKSKIFLGLVTLLTFYYVIVPMNILYGQIRFLFIFLALFYVALKLDNIPLNKILTTLKNIMTRCGDYSYGLYLLHLPIVMTICYSKFFMRLEHWQQFVFTFLGAGVVGLIYGYTEFKLYSQKLRPLANSLAKDIDRKIAAQAAKNIQTS